MIWLCQIIQCNRRSRLHFGSAKSSDAIDVVDCTWPRVWFSPPDRRSGERSSSSWGSRFPCVVADVEELTAGPAHEVAVENAYRKAAAVAAGASDALVLGVDTVVALGSTLYGKPRGCGRGSRHAERAQRTPARGGQWPVRDPGRTAADGGHHHAGGLPGARRRAPASGTSPAMSGASGLAATRSKAAARRWSRGSKAITRTSSVYPW